MEENSNPFQRIEVNQETMTKTDHDIAEYIVKHPVQIIRLTIEELAQSAGVSPSAVSRFCKRIGYDSFSNLKLQMARTMVAHNGTRDIKSKASSPAEAIARLYAQYIMQIPQFINDSDVEDIAAMFAKADHIKLFGINRTFNSARQMEQRLLRMGFDCAAVSELISMHDLSSILTPHDLVILFTINDNEQVYLPIAKSLHHSRCPLVCITMNPALSIKRFCQKYVVLPKISDDSSISFLDNQAIFFVYIEILLEAIAGTKPVSSVQKKNRKQEK